MNPIIKRTLLSIIRWALGWLGGIMTGWMVARGIIDADAAKELLNWLTGNAALLIFSFFATTILPWLWAWRKNITEAIKVRVALRLPPNTSPEKLKEEVKLEKRSPSPPLSLSRE
jgi:hypothetical protein